MAKIMCRYCKLNGYYLVTNNKFSLHIKKEALYKVLLFKKCRGPPSPIMAHPTCRNISAFKGKFKPHTS